MAYRLLQASQPWDCIYGVLHSSSEKNTTEFRERPVVGLQNRTWIWTWIRRDDRKFSAQQPPWAIMTCRSGINYSLLFQLPDHMY